MRIAHLCLSNWYVDGVGYQENELVREHVSAGHEVLVVASTETHSKAGGLTHTVPGAYVGDEGARIIRLPYRKILPRSVMAKIRANHGVNKVLEDFKPDSILFHGTCGWELLTVAAYVKKNPNVIFYVDSHEDPYNSARTWLSREILHKQFYARILRSALPEIRKILCYSPESVEFVHSVYRIGRSHLELYPLGGHPVADEEYFKARERIRRQYSLADDDVLIVQSGKQTERKKLLLAIRSFKQCLDSNLRFYVCGSISSNIETEVLQSSCSDPRICFLGWKSFDELTSLLCAADVYLQPGTQSVTMQHSLCCRCAVILDDVPSHRMYVQKNGWLIGRDGSLDEIIREIPASNLDEMKMRSYRFSRDVLDYKILAKRVFE